MTDETGIPELTPKQKKEVEFTQAIGFGAGFISVGFMIFCLLFLIIFITDSSKVEDMKKKYEVGSCALSDCQIIRVNEPVKVRVWLTPLPWPQLKMAQILNLSLADAVAFCQLQNETVSCQYNRRDPRKFCSMIFKTQPNPSDTKMLSIGMGISAIISCCIFIFSWTLSFSIYSTHLRKNQSLPPPSVIQTPGQTPDQTPGSYAAFP